MSVNLYGCVGHSELHDIEAADDLAGVLTNGGPFATRNGKNVSKKDASPRIREIGKESGNFGTNADSGERTRTSSMDLLEMAKVVVSSIVSGGIDWNRPRYRFSS